MKPMHHTRRSTIRRLAGGCAVLAALLTHVAALAQTAMEIANVPPFLPTPAAPNIVLTFDDSGSMRWAYAPDSLCGEHATRRAKSSDFNPLYYNPNVVYDPPLAFSSGSNSYTEYTTSFTAAKVNGFYDSHGTVNLSTSFRPTWSKDPAVATQNEIGSNAPSCSSTTDRLYNQFAGNPTQEYQNYRTGPTTTENRVRAGVPAYYYVYDPAFTKCSSAALTNDDCYRHVVVSSTSGPGGTDERQNFANWYSFYRTRNLMTGSAATRALKDVPVTARVAWQSLNTCNSTTAASPGRLFDSTCTGWAGASYDKRIKEFKGTHRQNLFTWLSRFPATGGTPLRTATSRVGEYFRTTGVNSPYAAEPQVSVGSAPHPLSCRPNFHILMTDGIWNDGTGDFCSGSRCNNADNTSVQLPLPADPKDPRRTYTPIAPYRDGNSDSVADVAFHYWATDLQPNLKNNLMPYWGDRAGTDDQKYWNPKNDPASWQHMVTFTVGLGLGRTFTAANLPWGGSTHAGTGYANLLAGTAWPATGADVTPGNVYDLWHAAINSRGQSFSADTPAELSRALSTALNRILERQSAAAALTANSTRLSTGTLLFQARFFSGTWAGSITAFPIDKDTGAIGAAQWEATGTGKIPTHDLRKIFSWSGSAGIAFDQTSLTAAGLWSHIGSATLLNYLRGDTSNEYPSGAQYRSRSSPIGDVINSDPVFVYAENYGYRALPSGSPFPEGSTYPAFVAAKKNRTKMLYVGSNDGMLRALDAETGQEKFAYVPNEVIPNLHALAARDYGHRFYVDGSPAAWDAHFGADGWKTILTGSTGAGGKSVFALDVTDPDGFSATKVLWEINQYTAQRTGETADGGPQYGTRLGYTIGQAVVAKLNNGEWVALFGNGYRDAREANAATAEASLYIVRLSDGKLIRRIDTGVAGTADEPNGLGTPTLHDVDGDEVYDVAYAPDNRGHVWKFDLKAANPASWRIAFATATGFPNGQPLFRARSAAGDVQPISARVELAAPPPGKPGIMVVFGTGRFFAGKDSSSLGTNSQSFYGIWDDGTPVTEPKRDTALQKQTITAPPYRTVDRNGIPMQVRDLTSEPVAWSTKRGWFIDLPDAGERVIGAASVRSGRVIFTTQVPSSDPCEFGGSGWLMEVSATTGGELPYSVFDTNGDGKITTADEVVGGVGLTVGMVKTPLVLEGDPAVKVLSGTSGNIQVERNRTFGPALGRESWRELQR